jgi:hypothetical protein
MNCTNDVLGHQWEHHAWRRRVRSAERVESSQADMWGRVVDDEHVVCHTEEVCSRCGETRQGADCMCDMARAGRCALLRAWTDVAGHAVA